MCACERKPVREETLHPTGRLHRAHHGDLDHAHPGNVIDTVTDAVHIFERVLAVARGWCKWFDDRAVQLVRKLYTSAYTQRTDASTVACFKYVRSDGKRKLLTTLAEPCRSVAESTSCPNTHGTSCNATTCFHRSSNQHCNAAAAMKACGRGTRMLKLKLLPINCVLPAGEPRCNNLVNDDQRHHAVADSVRTP